MFNPQRPKLIVMSVKAMRGWGALLIIIIVLNIATDHKRSAHYGASPTHVLCITRFHALVSNEEGLVAIHIATQRNPSPIDIDYKSM